MDAGAVWFVGFFQRDAVRWIGFERVVEKQDVLAQEAAGEGV